MATRRYGKKASKKVERAMRERKRGALRSGSGRKVRSRKQAIAIGLSEARREGDQVPPQKTAGRKKASRRKTSAKSKSAPRRKTAGRKTATRKRASKKKK
ncbi:MAG: DUF6496 domain-containing protein [Steroidobacteraceae bacterium]|nr:DUF6496 domain-containing protein [Steroidobacteraceae bacterium]